MSIDARAANSRRSSLLTNAVVCRAHGPGATDSLMRSEQRQYMQQRQMCIHSGLGHMLVTQPSQPVYDRNSPQAMVLHFWVVPNLADQVMTAAGQR